MASFYGDLADQAGSGNESEVSDVDPTEMAKMLEGLDDLDDDLFGSALKNKKAKSSGPSKAEAKAVLKGPDVSEIGSKSPFKPSVKEKKPPKDFSDFDVDDPLGDLLSDEDSAEKAKVKKNVAARAEHSGGSDLLKGSAKQDKVQKAKVIADLFGLDDAADGMKEGVTKSELSFSGTGRDTKDNLLGFGKPKLDARAKNLPHADAGVKQKSQDLISSKVNLSRRKSEGVKFGGDDILDHMGLDGDTKSGHGDKMLNISRSKTVMDELLGKRPEREGEFDSILDIKKNISKPDVPQNTSVTFGGYSPTISANLEKKRSRNNTSAADPLGLFSPPSTPQKKAIESNDFQISSTIGNKSKPVSGSDWLSLSGENEEERFQTPGTSDFKKSIFNESTIGIDLETKPRTHGVRGISPVHTATSHHQHVAESDSLPDWLGGGGGRAKRGAPSGTSQHQAAAPSPTQPQNVPAVDQEPVADHQPTSIVGELLANTQLEQQAMVALQRQEAALLAAAGLRAHEAQLAEVQRRQQTLLQQQEAQLKLLVERQVERQRILEEQLRAQQERISSHMQALLTQPPGLAVVDMPNVKPHTPPSPPPTPVPSASLPIPMPGMESGDTLNNDKLSETQMALQKSELQNKYMESKLDNLNSKHQEEVQLLEECYKRQMSILEEALKKQEERLRAENVRLEVDYKDRIARMQEQHAHLIEEHSRQLAVLQQERLTDLQRLRQQQGAMLEHVREAQKAEAVAVRDASEHMTTLQATVELLGRSAGGLGELQTRLEEQQRLQYNAREAALQAKELEAQTIRDVLQQQQEQVDQEKQRLLTHSESLTERQREMDESQRKLKQEHELLGKEQEQLRHDRQQLERMKQSILEEEKTVRQKLSEESLKLAAEKSRLESMARLQNSPSKQNGAIQMKAEAEMALAVAREAAERTQLERTSLKEQQRWLDSERRRLTELEHDLTVRARELTAVAEAATVTRNEGVQALAEAKRAERLQSQRAAELKKQLSELHEREQRLLQEKLNLSQERVSLNKYREHRLCSSCKGSLLRPNSCDRSVMSMSAPSKFVDPKVVILKLAAEKERDALENWSSLHSVSK